MCVVVGAAGGGVTGVVPVLILMHRQPAPLVETGARNPVSCVTRSMTDCYWILWVEIWIGYLGLYHFCLAYEGSMYTILSPVLHRLLNVNALSAWEHPSYHPDPKLNHLLHNATLEILVCLLFQYMSGLYLGR